MKDKGGSRGAPATIEAGEDGVDQAAVGGGKKGFPSGYLLKMELTGFTNRLARAY